MGSLAGRDFRPGWLVFRVGARGDDLFDADRLGLDVAERENVRDSLRATTEIGTREIEVLGHAPGVVCRPPQVRRQSLERVGCACDLPSQQEVVVAGNGRRRCLAPNVAEGGIALRDSEIAIARCCGLPDENFEDGR